MKTQLSNRATPVARLVALAWVIGLLSGCEKNQPLEPSLAAALTASSNLTVTAASASQIDLAWQDNSPNETGFEIHRSTTGPTGTFALLAKAGANVTSYSDGGLTPTTQYCYKVRAFKTSGRNTAYSAFSDGACATTLGPPPAPSNTNATPPSSIRVDVTWTDNSATENGFRVERSANSEGPWETIAQLGPNVTSHSDGNRAAEVQACYRVIAFNANGESGPSNVDCTAPPAVPTDLGATSVDAAQSIDLTWTDNSQVEDGYEVQRAGADFQFSVIANLPANASGYRDGSVNPDTRYWYRVRARKDGGGSDFSNYADARVVAAPPSAPSDNRAVPASSSAVSVFWVDASANADGFRVERSTDGGASWFTAGTTGLGQQSFFEEGRSAEQAVCYRVFAFNSKGESGPSNTACTAPPAAPSGLMAAPGEGSAIDLTWTDNSAVEDGYEVQAFFCDDPGYYYSYCYYHVIATLGPNATSYRDAAGGYSYVVWAVKDGGYSDPSNEAAGSLPAAPFDLSAMAVSSGQIDLAWTDNALDEELFAIERCRGDALACNDAGFVQIGWANRNATSFSDTGLQAGTTYTYRVRTYLGGFYSEPSNKATATTLP